MGAFGPPFFEGIMDTYITMTVSIPGKPLFGFKFVVENIYGTMTRAANPEEVFKQALSFGLTKVFGGSVKFESTTRAKAEAPDVPVEVPVKRKYVRRAK